MTHLQSAFLWIFNSNTILAMTPGQLNEFRCWLVSVLRKMEQLLIVCAPCLPLVLLILHEGLDGPVFAVLFGLFVMTMLCFVALDVSLRRARKLLSPTHIDSAYAANFQSTCEGSAWAKTMRDTLCRDGHTLCRQHMRIIVKHSRDETTHRRLIG